MTCKLSNTSAFLRCALGFLALLPFMIRERKKVGSLSKTGILLSLLAGLFLGIDFTAWNYSIYYVGSGIASVSWENLCFIKFHQEFNNMEMKNMENNATNKGNAKAYTILIIGIVFLAFTAPWVKLSNFEPAKV